VDNAVDKLKALGLALPYPHSSNVQGWEDLRELRPQGRQEPVAAALPAGRRRVRHRCDRPGGEKDKRGFDRACQHAIDRLAELEGDEDEREQGEEESTES
jgi:hypothetical protein